VFCYCCLLFATLVTNIVAGAADKPLVSPMFGDNMVLQRGKSIRFWGWTKPGESVSVELDGKTATAVAAPDSRWQVEMKSPAPGGPYTVKIISPGQQVILHEILVGDVWLCGGQSNMELGLARTRHGTNEIAAADHPEIRLFKVQSQVAYSPALVPQGTWKICSPQTVAENGGFSAVAYYFGMKLQDELHVPIGLIEDCVGGTPAESWISPESLHKLGDFDEPLAEIQRLHAQGGPEYGSFLMHWLDEYDIGLKNSGWAAPDLDESGWQSVRIPGGFSDSGLADEPGICWFRKEFTLPDPLPPGLAVLHLGSIDKMDTSYLNGHWVGASSWVENPRTYFIAEGLLHPGRNVLAVRVFKLKSGDGFLGRPDEIRLTLGNETSIPLAGEWKGKLSVDARPPHPLPLTSENYPTMPAVLYEGMIKPVAPFTIRGAIWYQGEANFQRAHQYRVLLPMLISDWRQLFQEGDFPFYIVSLPAFMHHRDEAGDDAWAELREAQALTAQKVKNSALAVTVDTGDPDNIHPQDKEVVGDRLALCALAGAYNEKITSAGPTYDSVSTLPGALKIRFKHTEGGLVVKGGKPGEFCVAGADRKWHWADANIEGDCVVVSSADVPEPVAARYAWQAYPVATLYNGAGLPAVPFRTDDWPGLTDQAKPW
jgi:sialate O-acetylesterase